VRGSSSTVTITSVGGGCPATNVRKVRKRKLAKGGVIFYKRGVKIAPAERAYTGSSEKQ